MVFATTRGNALYRWLIFHPFLPQLRCISSLVHSTSVVYLLVYLQSAGTKVTAVAHCAAVRFRTLLSFMVRIGSTSGAGAVIAQVPEASDGTLLVNGTILLIILPRSLQDGRLFNKKLGGLPFLLTEWEGLFAESYGQPSSTVPSAISVATGSCDLGNSPTRYFHV